MTGLLYFINPQLTAVNSVVFTVKAIDADGDTITYIIDRASVWYHEFELTENHDGTVCDRI